MIHKYNRVSCLFFTNAWTLAIFCTMGYLVQCIYWLRVQPHIDCCYGPSLSGTRHMPISIYTVHKFPVEAVESIKFAQIFVSIPLKINLSPLQLFPLPRLCTPGRTFHHH